MEQHFAELTLKPFDLNADGRLRSPQLLSGSGKAARVDDRYERSEKVDVKIGEHGYLINNSNSDDFKNEFPKCNDRAQISVST